MFRSIKNLACVYFREKWLKEIWGIIVVLVVFSWLAYTAKGTIEEIRELFIWFAVSGIALGSIFEAFKGYKDRRKSYFKLLVPASAEAKFIWEWFRTLVYNSVLILGVLFVVDATFEYFILEFSSDADRVSEMLSARSLKDTLFMTNEPLNYLPIKIYILILGHSTAFLVSTRSRKAIDNIVSVLFVAAVCVLIYFLPISDDSSLLYPFISEQEQWNFLSIQLSWAPRGVEYILSYMWLGAMPIAFYLLAYFRLKEIEV